MNFLNISLKFYYAYPSGQFAFYTCYSRFFPNAPKT